MSKLITMRNKDTQDVIRVTHHDFLHYWNLGYKHTTNQFLKNSVKTNHKIKPVSTIKKLASAYAMMALAVDAQLQNESFAISNPYEGLRQFEPIGLNRGGKSKPSKNRDGRCYSNRVARSRRRNTVSQKITSNKP